MSPVGPTTSSPNIDIINWALLASQGSPGNQGPQGSVGQPGTPGSSGTSGSAGTSGVSQSLGPALIQSVPYYNTTTSLTSSSSLVYDTSYSASAFRGLTAGGLKITSPTVNGDMLAMYSSTFLTSPLTRFDKSGNLSFLTATQSYSRVWFTSMYSLPGGFSSELPSSNQLKIVGSTSSLPIGGSRSWLFMTFDNNTKQTTLNATTNFNVLQGTINSYINSYRVDANLGVIGQLGVEYLSISEYLGYSTMAGNWYDGRGSTPPISFNGQIMKTSALIADCDIQLGHFQSDFTIWNSLATSSITAYPYSDYSTLNQGEAGDYYTEDLIEGLTSSGFVIQPNEVVTFKRAYTITYDYGDPNSEYYIPSEGCYWKATSNYNDLENLAANVETRLNNRVSSTNLALNTPLSIDNLVIQVKTQESGVWIFAGTLTGTATYSYSITYQIGNGNTQGTSDTISATTTVTTLGVNTWLFNTSGASATAIITDTTNSKMYRITWMTTTTISPYGNYLTIERLT